MEYLRALGKYSSGIALQELPQNVVDKAKLCLLDFVGVVLGSLAIEEATQGLRQYLEAVGSGGVGQASCLPTGQSALRTPRSERPVPPQGPHVATVLGLGEMADPRDAAFCMGAMAEVLEFQDTDSFTGGHPGSCIPAAVLAMAEAQNSAGPRLLEGIVAGYEVYMRIGATMGPSHRHVGFTPTGTLGALGVAAAVARLLGFSEKMTTAALGNAAYLAPLSLTETFFGGYSVKPFHAGQAARIGIEAAVLAGAGFAGSPRVLEGSSENGPGLCQMGSNAPRPEAAVAGMGERYGILEVAFKAFPACGMTHSAIQAALKASSDGVPAGSVSEIRVMTSPDAQRFCGRYTDPSSSYRECQFSIPYVVAVTLIDGKLGPDQFAGHRIQDSSVHQLAQKVKVLGSQRAEGGPAPATTRLELDLPKGKTATVEEGYRKGHPSNPMSSGDLVDKFVTLAAPVLGQKEAQKVASLIMNMEKLESFRSLLQALGRRQS